MEAGGPGRQVAGNGRHRDGPSQNRQPMTLLPQAPDVFTREERRIIQRHRTPEQVQRFLRRLPYNWELHGDTLRSFREVVRLKTAHCLEAALVTAVILEQHGYPPLVVSFESQDRAH